ncbi:MAG TPA: TolC family protein [Acidobacteriaceae bacterium]|nr:TolC family protein [Acidobacteriaceae bacterium]
MFAWSQHSPATPNAPWISRKLQRNEIAVVPMHEAELKENEVYTLGQLIDIAESNNPATRAAWEQAKVRAASVGIAKSELYPTVIATAAGRTFLNPPLLYKTFVLQDIGLFETALHLNYTLVDFGARRSKINAAQARLLAANLNFNYQHLLLIQQVSHAYYALLNATGLREAAEITLSDAKEVQAAAEDRKKNGLATLPDVLEARAATATANYDLQSAIGAEQTAFGNLATALTATPVRSFKVEPLRDLHIPESLDQSVEDAIQSAFQQRPDLLAAVARVRAGRAEVKHARTAYYPTIEFDGEKGWLRAWGKQEGYPGTYGQTMTYDARLSMRWTIFDGLKRESRLARAKSEERAAVQEVHEREDTVADHVWSDYANVVTALQQRKAATSLLRATTESYSAAVESYKDGVRNILDVLSAERELAHARAVDVTGRTQVLQSLTDLSFRTGDLLTQHPKGTHP